LRLIACVCSALPFDLRLIYFLFFFFFFQAEDGIRDSSVTGVQTCALPISEGPGGDDLLQQPGGRLRGDRQGQGGHVPRRPAHGRSEERRVGKECRSGGATGEKKEERAAHVVEPERG